MRSTRNFRLILLTIFIQKSLAVYHWDGKECQKIFDKEKVIRGSKTQLTILIEISKLPGFKNNASNFTGFFRDIQRSTYICGAL